MTSSTHKTRNECAQLSDQELLSRWRAGAAEAGDRLLRRHVRPLRSFFARRGVADPEDLLQRTFLACIRARDRFRGDSSFRTFLYAIAHNAFIDHRRRLQVLADRPAQEVPEDLADAEAVSALETTMVTQRLWRVRLAMARLPRADRELLMAYVDDELSGPAIASRLGISIPAFRSRVRRARTRLRSELATVAASPRRSARQRCRGSIAPL